MTTVTPSEPKPLEVGMSMMGAVLSDCHRYRLWRHWNTAGEQPRTLGVLLLNPSTANALKDDPTIRQYARRRGEHSLERR